MDSGAWRAGGGAARISSSTSSDEHNENNDTFDETRNQEFRTPYNQPFRPERPEPEVRVNIEGLDLGPDPPNMNLDQDGAAGGGQPNPPPPYDGPRRPEMDFRDFTAALTESLTGVTQTMGAVLTEIRQDRIQQGQFRQQEIQQRQDREVLRRQQQQHQQDATALKPSMWVELKLGENNRCSIENMVQWMTATERIWVANEHLHHLPLNRVTNSILSGIGAKAMNWTNTFAPDAQYASLKAFLETVQRTFCGSSHKVLARKKFEKRSRHPKEDLNIFHTELYVLWTLMYPEEPRGPTEYAVLIEHFIKKINHADLHRQLTVHWIPQRYGGDHGFEMQRDDYTHETWMDILKVCNNFRPILSENKEVSKPKHNSSGGNNQRFWNTQRNYQAPEEPMDLGAVVRKTYQGNNQRKQLPRNSRYGRGGYMNTGQKRFFQPQQQFRPRNRPMGRQKKLNQLGREQQNQAWRNNNQKQNNYKPRVNKNNTACFTCGAPDHWSNNCPKKKLNKSFRPKVAQIQNISKSQQKHAKNGVNGRKNTVAVIDELPCTQMWGPPEDYNYGVACCDVEDEVSDPWDNFDMTTTYNRYDSVTDHTDFHAETVIVQEPSSSNLSLNDSITGTELTSRPVTQSESSMEINLSWEEDSAILLPTDLFKEDDDPFLRHLECHEIIDPSVEMASFQSADWDDLPWNETQGAVGTEDPLSNEYIQSVEDPIPLEETSKEFSSDMQGVIGIDSGQVNIPIVEFLIECPTCYREIPSMQYDSHLAVCDRTLEAKYTREGDNVHVEVTFGDGTISNHTVYCPYPMFPYCAKPKNNHVKIKTCIDNRKKLYPGPDFIFFDSVDHVARGQYILLYDLILDDKTPGFIDPSEVCSSSITYERGKPGFYLDFPILTLGESKDQCDHCHQLIHDCKLQTLSIFLKSKGYTELANQLKTLKDNGNFIYMNKALILADTSTLPGKYPRKSLADILLLEERQREHANNLVIHPGSNLCHFIVNLSRPDPKLELSLSECNISSPHSQYQVSSLEGRLQRLNVGESKNVLGGHQTS